MFSARLALDQNTEPFTELRQAIEMFSTHLALDQNIEPFTELRQAI